MKLFQKPSAAAVSLLTALSLLSLGQYVFAQGSIVGATSSSLLYKVGKGDRLQDIAEQVTGDTNNWRAIAAANKLSRADAIRANQTLSIPLNLIAAQAVAGRIEAQNGPVTVLEGPVVAPQAIGEGSKVVTGPNASVTLLLPDGTRVKIDPSSTVIVERLRQYYSDRAIETRLRLESGSVAVDSVANRPRPFTVTTPRSTAAVRGTQFRVAASSDGDSRAEVLRGSIAFQTAKSNEGIPQAKGVALPAKSDTPVVETLLPAPQLGAALTVLSIDTTISWPTLNATQYRALVTRDQKADDIVVGSLVNQPSVRFSSPDDGVYFLHVRGISAVGIQGFEAVQQVNVAARPLAPQFLDLDNTPVARGQAPVMQWAPSATASSVSTRVQIATDYEFTQLLMDRVVQATQLEVPAEAKGKKVFFRFAALQDTPKKQGPFGGIYSLSW
jgi:hypothetical protein